jgi:2-methylcitrate dehydratase PrpD
MAAADRRLETADQPAYLAPPQRGNTMADETATLAAYVANLKFEDIPHDVRERAKALTLDFLGSAVRARRDAESTPSMLKML